MNVSAELAELSRTIDAALLGRRIKVARVAAGLTQTQLATPEASTAYLSRIESGDRRPDLKLLVRWAEKTNVSLEQLLVGVSTDQRMELLLNLDLAKAAILAGSGFDAMERLGQVRNALTESPTSDLWPRVRLLDAEAHRVIGNLDDAIVGLEDLVKPGTDAPVWLAAAVELTDCYLESNDPNRCIDIGEQVMDLLTERGLGACAEATRVATLLASALRARGDDARAFEVLSAATDAPETQGAAVRAYLEASLAERENNNLCLAYAFASRASDISERAKEQGSRIRLHVQLGELLLSGTDPDVAAARRALEVAAGMLSDASSDPAEGARVHLALAKARFLEGDVDGAIESLPSVETLESAKVLAASRWLMLGKIQRATRKVKAARESLAEAARALQMAEADRTSAQIWFELGAMFDDIGDKEASGDAYRQAARATGLDVARPARKAVRAGAH